LKWFSRRKKLLLCNSIFYFRFRKQHLRDELIQEIQFKIIVNAALK
jgi:hypothetical protein